MRERPAPVPASSAGPRHSRRNSMGFTLLELVVVVTLLSLMLFMAIPRFQQSFADDTRKTAQWLMVQVPRLKSMARLHKKVYFLNVDLSEQLFWISHAEMNDTDIEAALKQAHLLPEGVRILDVVPAGGDTTGSGVFAIGFYPKGYSDRVLLHLENDRGTQWSLLVEPFLIQAELKEGYVDFKQ